MVSSGTVNGDLSSFKSSISNYNSTVGSLDSSWKGNSADSLLSQFDSFVSEFSGTIESQMSNFASACDLYEQYKQTKQSLLDEKKEYQSKVANNDGSSDTYLRNLINSLESKLSSLKSAIESYLSSVSSKTLTATSLSTGSISGSFSSGGAVQSAIDWAVSIAEDDSYGYSQNTRWGNPNYDCSSFVISSWENAGVEVKEAGASSTRDMKNAFLSTGQFEWIPGNPNVDDLQPGDVLLAEGRHTEMYIGDGMNVGAHDDFDNSNGDSSGKEVNVANYYNHPWTGVLRYIGDN